MNIIIFNENHKNIIEGIILHGNYDTNIIENRNFWTLKGFNADLALDIAGIARMKLDVISNNIANINTINANGLPYIRKYVKISVENGIEIVEDIENYPKFVFDLTHPNAIGAGEMQGYVKYSNVNIEKEMLDLIEATRLYEVAIEYLKKNNYIIL